MPKICLKDLSVEERLFHISELATATVENISVLHIYS